MTGRMGYGSTGLEFLRFGSSIPGSYWGCCACDIIQNFNQDPDSKSSIQKVSGDGGESVGDKFYGPTQRDIFNQRLREGTFGSRDMPNHAFLAILTQNQLNSGVGKKWLAILKESGFEFIRTVCNSVYAGPGLGKPTGEGQARNYIFGLFRNIGKGAPEDQYTPPKEWLSLPSVGKCETYDFILETAAANRGVEATLMNSEADTAIWDKIGPVKLMTAKEVEEAGAPVVLAGQRGEFPQETKAARDNYVKSKGGKTAKTDTASALCPQPVKTEPVVAPV